MVVWSISQEKNCLSIGAKSRGSERCFYGNGLWTIRDGGESPSIWICLVAKRDIIEDARLSDSVHFSPPVSFSSTSIPSPMKQTGATRKPYTGQKKAIAIALDVGTTFSGASYAILDPGEIPKIYEVTR